MRKRGNQSRHRARAIPGLVVQFVSRDYELQLRCSVSAFSLGCAEAAHFNDLADCCDLLRIGEHLSERKDDSAVAAGEIGSIALMNIRARHAEHGRFEAEEEEVGAIELMADASLEFWNRRSGALYRAAFAELRRLRRAEQAAAQPQPEGVFP